jgi:hypothetical protein
LKRKRLSDEEIRKAVEKIRQRYADYMVRYQKPRNALNDFEERYISVLRVRMDLALFLHAEKEAVEQLIDKEEQRIKSEAESVEKKNLEHKKEQDFADRVIAENMNRIQKYPRLSVHDEASEEVERLFGTLATIDKDFWPVLEVLIRKTYVSILISPRQRLEERLLALCGTGRTELPPRLSRYRSLFDWFPRNYLEIDKESKKCILDGAFFLHDFHDTLKEIRASEGLSVAERVSVEKMIEYVHIVIQDFRLKDFKSTRR